MRVNVRNSWKKADAAEATIEKRKESKSVLKCSHT